MLGKKVKSTLSSPSHRNRKRDTTLISVLVFSLDLQRDENEALRAALERTLAAKQDDLRLYQQIMDETKRVFLQGLRQHRNDASA